MAEKTNKMLKKLVRAREEEKRKIARDLHDSVVQTLAHLHLEIDKLAQKTSLPENVCAKLKEFDEITLNAQKELRSICAELRPELLLADMNLDDSLKTLVEGMKKRIPNELSFHVIGTPRRLPKRLNFATFRVAQECLNNVWKHAEANKISTDLIYDTGKINLVISDNGKGFDVNQKSIGKIGLKSMRERAKLINAHLNIDSTPGKGTIINLEIKK